MLLDGLETFRRCLKVVRSLGLRFASCAHACLDRSRLFRRWGCPRTTDQARYLATGDLRRPRCHRAERGLSSNAVVQLGLLEAGVSERGMAQSYTTDLCFRRVQSFPEAAAELCLETARRAQLSRGDRVLVSVCSLLDEPN